MTFEPLPSRSRRARGRSPRARPSGCPVATPPTRFIPYVLRLPVIFSISHITGSRIRHVCMRTVSNPRMWPGDAEPEQVAVDPLQLEDDRADVARAQRGLAPRPRSPAPARTAVECTIPQMPQMRSATKRHLVVGQLRVAELLDAAVVEEAAVVEAHHLLAVREHLQEDRLLEHREERADRDGHRACPAAAASGGAACRRRLRLDVVRARRAAAGAAPRASRRPAPAAAGPGDPRPRCRAGPGTHARPTPPRARRGVIDGTRGSSADA